MATNLNSSEESPTFTDRLRVIGQPILDPIVTVLARWGVSPNVLTIVGMLGHFLSAGLLAAGYVSYAGLSLMVIAPLDAFDGALARKLKLTQGGFGAFLDSTSDRIAEIVLFCGFIIYYHQLGDQMMLVVAYAALTGSLMVSYVRARAEGLGFECKVGLFGRVERYLVIMPLLALNLPTLIVLDFSRLYLFHPWATRLSCLAAGAKTGESRCIVSEKVCGCGGSSAFKY